MSDKHLNGRHRIERGWLIENGKQGSELRYMDWDDGLVIWTASHLNALRFCRRMDAEKMIGDASEPLKAVEHQWLFREPCCDEEG